MKFSYEDLLSGDNIFVEGVGHIRSPKLRELRPSEGIGINLYNVYLSVLSWDKDEYLKFLSGKQAELLGNDKLTMFDAMATLKPDFRELLGAVLEFFLVESLTWDDEGLCFIASADSKAVGKIDRSNFDKVRDMMLQMNYINLGKFAEPKHASAKAKKYWDLAQQKRKEALKSSSQNKSMGIGNLISKLCAGSTGYTFHNVYDLTIYQLYDQFFQYSHLRSRDLMENAYATHGGEKFDYHEWMKPIPELMKT